MWGRGVVVRGVGGGGVTGGGGGVGVAVAVVVETGGGGGGVAVVGVVVVAVEPRRKWADRRRSVVDLDLLSSARSCCSAWYLGKKGREI